MTLDSIFFLFFAGMAVLFAVLMLTRRSALSGAICLIVCFLSFAGLYAMLDAPFVAAMQVLVYAGAIMMLIVFVIMTVDLREEERRRHIPAIVGGIVAAIVVGAGIVVYTLAARGLPAGEVGGAGSHGTVAAVGKAMFSRHVLNFEMLSLLLLVALVGALVLTKKRKDN